MDHLLGLSGDLRRFFVDYVKVFDGRKRVMEILAVFQYGRCCRLGVFFDKRYMYMTRTLQVYNICPSLNRNIGKMSIPHCFDNLLGAKPKHPRVGELSVAPLPVEEVAPLSQIPGLNLTQFNNIGDFRPNVAIHIPRHSTRACRAKNLFNWLINWRCHNIHKIKASSLTPDNELSNVIPSNIPPK